jgi:protein-disulfide isomerase
MSGSESAEFEARRTKRRRLLFMAGAFVFVLVVIPLGWFGSLAYGYYTMIRSGAISTPEDRQIQLSIANVAVNADVTDEDLERLKPAGMAPELGSRAARVTVVEFVDYQCPYSAESAHAVRRIMEEMGDRVHFLMRDYPVIDPSGRSRAVALAANCVLEQGQEPYWRFQELVFADQTKTTDADFREYASLSSADMGAYDACVSGRKYDLKIDGDIEVGKRAGVQGTPAFFVNGVKYEGSLDEKLLSRILNYFLDQLPK